MKYFLSCLNPIPMVITTINGEQFKLGYYP